MYYLITVQNDSTPSMLGYESLSAAESAFHTELAYRHEERNITRCMIINERLEILRSESYTKKSTVPEED